MLALVLRFSTIVTSRFGAHAIDNSTPTPVGLVKAALLSALLASLLPAPGWADESEVRIGVLTHRGKAATLAAWSPTADYLTRAVSGARFRIVPLGFEEVEPDVRAGSVDFLLVNSGIYVAMEVSYQASRIATLNNRQGNHTYNRFGGVIFTRAARQDLQQLRDLKGHSFMAVDEISLGGFQMAWRELHAVGIDPRTDFAPLSFAGTHDDVVRAVMSGKVDAGAVRTDILERMAASGELILSKVRVLGARHESDFPVLHSTQLYPEWPFAKLRHTPNALAKAVAVALLGMPEDAPAARAGHYAGWTVPLDYQAVHEVLKELGLRPYENVGKLPLKDALARYWYWVLTVGLLTLFVLLMAVWVLRLNRSLARSKSHLERQHALILNSVSDGIYGVDRDGNATFVNRATQELTGWRAGELIGRNQHRLMHHTQADGSPHPEPECPVYATFRDNMPRFVDDDVFWRKDGSSFRVEYTSTPIRDRRNGILGSVVVFRDITERRRVEENLHQHQLELAHVSRLSTMGEMAAGIAHELNQPLTAISANARACLRLLDAGEAQLPRCVDVLDRIAAQAQRAGEIIRQLRQFVRKEQPERAPLPIHALIDEALVWILPEAKRAGVSLATEHRDPQVEVEVQRIQVEQVLINLGHNAIEAMCDAGTVDGRLTIRSGVDGTEQVRVTVEDNGPGVAAEAAECLFNPFFTTKAQGLGLGLSISEGIIEAHGGRLTLETCPGGGARFSFTLPRPNAGQHRLHRVLEEATP